MQKRKLEASKVQEQIEKKVSTIGAQSTLKSPHQCVPEKKIPC
jgi:hypothetical protein